MTGAVGAGVAAGSTSRLATAGAGAGLTGLAGAAGSAGASSGLPTSARRCTDLPLQPPQPERLRQHAASRQANASCGVVTIRAASMVRLIALPLSGDNMKDW